MSLIKRFARNVHGRDIAVGDVHGHFTRLQQALDAYGFDPSKDRLFLVGDLVDRGPECRNALDWLAKPWVHSVRGNHDDYVVRFDTCDVENWIYNGGSWFAGLSRFEQLEFAAQFRELPFAIEVMTPRGMVGLVHADCPVDNWRDLLGALDSKNVRNACMWSRTRVEQGDEREVEGITAVVVGHTPLKVPALLGNVYHIDTGGWLPSDGGYFTLLDLQTLEATPPMLTKLEWADL